MKGYLLFIMSDIHNFISVHKKVINAKLGIESTSKQIKI